MGRFGINDNQPDPTSFVANPARVTRLTTVIKISKFPISTVSEVIVRRREMLSGAGAAGFY